MARPGSKTSRNNTADLCFEARRSLAADQLHSKMNAAWSQEPEIHLKQRHATTRRLAVTNLALGGIE
jgi:hypothetical protein